jgi:predicted transcriptional regulator
VKPETGPQVRPERGSEMRITAPVASRVKARLDLTAGELEVLELLLHAGTSLTVWQLEARVPSSAPVEETLRLLMERGLVARLNTIVPSYTCRRADAGVHAS